MKSLYIFILTFCLVSCSQKKEISGLVNSKIRYSSLLRMYPIEDCLTICQILNPWRNNEILAQYLIAPKNLEYSEEKIHLAEKTFGKSTILRTPLNKITLTSSCHGYILEQIGALDNIAVFCDAEYIIYNKVKERILSGKIANAGNSQNPSAEIIFSNGSDAIWVSPFENFSQSSVSNLSIPIIYCADYMETSPLGSAEWMSFFGLLVNQKEKADSLFCLIEKNYKYIMDSISFSQNSNLPKTLLAELPYQSTWYVPGGESTMGIMYKDAGYKYQWAEDENSGSIALSPEAVLAKAKNSDVWIFKYYADHKYTKKEFVALDKYFGQFDAVKNGEIYGCNTMLTDFYDVTPFRPDILLEEITNFGNIYFHKIE